MRWVVATALTGCATMMAARGTRISVDTRPEGASVDVNGRAAGTTPTSIVLRGEDRARIAIHRPGFEPVMIVRTKQTTAWFAGNLLLLGLFPIGMLVDIATGAVSQLDNAPISIALTALVVSNPDDLQVPDDLRSSLWSLVQQADAAARAGDCATVAEIDVRITAMDRRFRDRVFARVLAISSCAKERP